MLKITRTIVTLIAGLSVAAGGFVHADGFEDPDSIAWKFRYGLSSAAYGNAWQTYRDAGYLPIDIETDNIGSVKYAGVWQKNSDNRGWKSWRNLTSAGFSERWREYRGQGYRPIDQDAEIIGGNVRYSLIMVENKEGLKWKSNRNLSSAQFSEKFNANKGEYKPIDIDAVEVGGQMRYSIIWLENKANKDWAELRDMTPAVYGQKFVEYRRLGYRVAELDCYSRDARLTYAAIWEKNEPGRGWAAKRGMSATGLRNSWKKYHDQGLRLIDIEVCPAASGGGTRYAAVWRENDQRYDWAGRGDAEQSLKDFVTLNDAPGVSAAIISNGKRVFRAGAGFADKEKNVAAHSGTIYRTASIAKAITGALGFDLQDAGIINLSDQTDSIVTNLANDHDHTVLELLQNAGCFGNYGNVPGSENSDQTQYPSAQATLTDKQDGVLASNDAIYSPCTPGSSYKYSTHGYTAAAAAFEVESGTTFDVLLKQRIADTLGLPTLRAETRTSPDSSGELARLYGKKAGGGFEPVTDSKFQNTSWKWAGGGMQSSPLDLAKFGNALLDNNLFPQSARDQMWSGSGASGTYGAGWDLSSATLVQKWGRQQAALAHIRLDVDDDIVVVAMTNGSYSQSEIGIISTLTSGLMGLAKANP